MIKPIKVNGRIEVLKLNLNSNGILSSQIWTLWGQAIEKCRTQTKPFQNSFSYCYSFSPAIGSNWFFSINSGSLIDSSKFRYLCFDLKLSGTGKLEIGYGNAAKNIAFWFAIEAPQLKCKFWHQVRIEFDKKDPIKLFGNSLVVRGNGFSSEKRISISEIYFEA